MTTHSPNTPGRRTGSDLSLFLGLTAVTLFFLASGVVAYLNTRTLSRGTAAVTRTHEVLTALDNVLALLKDAETGQRGFVITGDERYLAPYTAATNDLDAGLGRLESLVGDRPEHQARLPRLKQSIDAKLTELRLIIDLRRGPGGPEAARAAVLTDRGKDAMEDIRGRVEEMEGAEREARGRRIAEMEDAYRVSVASGVLSGLLGVVLSGAVGYLVRRAVVTRRREEWLQSGQVGLAEAAAGERRLDQLGESVLRFLAVYLDAHAGAVYGKDGADFRLLATYGVPDGGVPARFNLGDGLLGQVAKDGRAVELRDVPDGYLTVGSALGRGTPRQLLVAPFQIDGAVNAVLELGFVHPVPKPTTDLLARASELLGTAVRSANYRANLQNLLEETQRQAEELQAQQEELRVSNEELEEQGRALRESAARLEQQQAELEQGNSQLEDQARLLEAERDAAGAAKAALEVKARELEQASQYKSDFLANMSHELRTPLNSSLILAKLLADNPAGNLTPEQVQYATTIHSAGNDLLVLINDILDLAKIEAGHMEVRPEPVRLAALADDLARVFRPVAEQAGLGFETRVSPSCPAEIETDRQRLEQVLKNLLSNALKFTHQGRVSLDVGPAPGDRVAFAVRDTGIGIPAAQQEVIFEAFRQADGTTNRKYGGTGLGLSIARELARLLGGEIRLESEPDKGSTFTVLVPTAYDPAAVRPRDDRPAPPP
ncbi:MAG TPA: CHASE3 domain-containing protein, partial [Gemmataceae bacterium]|nr:CHASE3 domain-containing protein [Gemmataceae bacterium]